MNNLPREMMEEIVGYLEDKHLLRLSKTCTSWYAAVQYILARRINNVLMNTSVTNLVNCHTTIRKKQFARVRLYMQIENELSNQLQNVDFENVYHQTLYWCRGIGYGLLAMMVLVVFMIIKWII